MANISREEDNKDYEERMRNNGNRPNVIGFKSEKQKLQDAEDEAIRAQNNLKEFIRKNG